MKMFAFAVFVVMASLYSSMCVRYGFRTLVFCGLVVVGIAIIGLLQFIGALIALLGAIVMWPLSFFILDGMALWFVLGVFGVLALVSIEYERPGWCTTVLTLTAAFMEFYTPWHPITRAIHYPIYAVTLVGLYFAAGTFWIVVKWTSHVYLVKRKFDAVKDGALTKLGNSSSFRNPDNSLTNEGRKKLYEMAADQIGERELPLRVSRHKSELYMWWACWPLSMFWTVLNDPIKRLWWFVYDQIGNTLQNISNRAFKID